MSRVFRRYFLSLRRRLPALAFTLPCLVYLTTDIGRQDSTALLLALAEHGSAWHLSLVAVPTGTSVTRFDGQGIVTTPMMGAALSASDQRSGILSASGDITGSISPGDVVVKNVRVNRSGKGDLPITRMTRLEVQPEEKKPGVLFNFASAFENVTDAAIPEKSFIRPLAPIVARLDPQAPLPVDNGTLPVVPQLMPKDSEAAAIDYDRLKPYAIRTEKDLKRAQYCLTEAVYFESRSEPVKGQRAVAQVVLNRVKSGTYPQNVCDVVYQNKAKRRTGCQFSYTCDGFPERVRDLKSWATAKQVADDALMGKIFLADVGDSTHYHADWVFPDWRRELRRQKKIGAHIFYSVPGRIINGT